MVADLWVSGGLLPGGRPMVDNVGAEELKLGCWKIAEPRSGGCGRGARAWWVVELGGEMGVAGRSFDVLSVFRGRDDSKDSGGNRGTNVSVGPCNDG